MYRWILVSVFLLMVVGVFSQSSMRVHRANRYSSVHTDNTGRVYFDTHRSIGKKIGIATGYTFAYGVSIYGLLYALPVEVSQWNSATKRNFGSNYKSTFTKPIALDKDRWYVNYLGHPYQGSFYYNSMRAQGAEMWQSSMFAFANTFAWEFLLEGAIEQPSVQDLLVTPIAGTLLGELFHYTTLRMSRKGYTWYEKAFVCVFNPAFAIHNGFKWAKPRRMDL